ncbi:MarR family winged helix-turn-helix transcriptional regulator [Emcibacter sp.]|uniref:MarR family winged helix-turn-helix transcriptional regulator n=1 Tax=Emcibacter sp. TaxID=1979954 RepID=UPI002AA7ACF4|nr:MarR family transcriptional regulator [Emcibacter sp.]
MNEKQNQKSKRTTMTISNPLENLLGYHLRRASAAMISQLSQGFSALDLKITETSVLVMVEANPGMKQSDIGRALGIKSANMAPLVAVLSDRGLIRKKPLDGRSQGLHLSEEGKKVVKKIWENINANEEWLARSLDKDSFDSLKKTLNNIWL